MSDYEIGARLRLRDRARFVADAKRAERAIDDLGDESERSGKQAKGSASAWDAVSASVRRNRDEARRSKRDLDSQSTATQNLTRHTSRLRRGIDAATGAMRGFRDHFRRTARDVGQQKLQVDADTALAQARIADLQRQLREAQSVDVDVDDTAARLKIARLQAQLARLDTQVNVDVDAESMTRFGGVIDRIGGSLARTNQRFAFFRNMMRLMIWPAAIAGVGLLTQAIGALTAGVVALTSALAPLTGLVAVVPAGLSALAQGMNTVKLATSGLDDALKAVAEGTAEELREAMSGLSEPAQAFVRTYGRLRPTMLGIRREAERGLFPGVTDAFRRVISLAPLARDVFRQTGTAMGDLARRGAQLVTSGPFAADLETQAGRNIAIIRRFGQGLLNITDALRHVTLAAGPLVSWVSRLTLGWTESWRAAARTGRETGRLAAWFDTTRAAVERLMSIGGSLITIFGEIGRAAAPLGAQIFATWDRNLRSIANRIQTLHAQRSLADYFREVRAPLFETGRLAVDLGKALFTISRDRGFTPLIRQVRTELLPVLVEVIRKLTRSFGPALIDALVQVSRLIGAMAGHTGPFATFVRTIGGLAGALANLIERNPGIARFGVQILSMVAAFKALKLVGAVSGVSALVRGLGSLIGFVPGLGRTAAATKTVTTQLGAYSRTVTTTAAPATGGLISKISTLAGPMTLGGAGLLGALGAAGVAIGIFARRQAASQERVQALTRTLDQQTGAYTRNTRKQVEAELRAKGLDSSLLTLGLTYKDVTAAAMGNTRAQARVSAALRIAERRHLNNSVAADGSTRASTQFSSASSKVSDALGTQSGELRTAQRENGQFRRTQDAVSAAARRQTGAQGRTTDATKAYREALQGLSPKARAHLTDLRETARQGKLTEREIEQLHRRYGLTPKELRTKVRTDGVPRAQADLRRFHDQLRGMVGTMSVGSLANRMRLGQQAGTGLAEGGLLRGPGTGTSDSITAVDRRSGAPLARVSSGEYVVNAKSTRRFHGMLEAINNFRGGGQIGGWGGAGSGPPTYRRLWQIVSQKFPGAQMTSGHRPGDTDSYHGSGHAIDIAPPARSISSWIAANYRAVTDELIHTGGVNLYKGQPHVYSAQTRADHLDHVHWASDAQNLGGGAQGMAGLGPVLRNAILNLGWRVSRFPQGDPVGVAARPLVKTRMIMGRGTSGVAGVEPGAARGGVRGLMAQLARANGIGGAGLRAWYELVSRESSFNPRATNPTSGAYGLPQALPPGKMASAGADWKTNPATQLRWMIGYVRGRYGSMQNALGFHDRNNWYDYGGWLPRGESRAMNTSGGAELVLPRPGRVLAAAVRTGLEQAEGAPRGRRDDGGVRINEVHIHADSYAGGRDAARGFKDYLKDRMARQ